MKTVCLTLSLVFSVVSSVSAQTMVDIVRWQAEKDTPETPKTPVPATSATLVPLSPTLSWVSIGATLGYDVYFGTSSNPPKVSTVTTPSYQPPALQPTTRYYWKIVAKNPVGTRTGAVWSFTTAPLPTPLVATCAANVSVATVVGATTAVATFPLPTTVGGTLPVVSTCAPASGTSFPVGTTSVVCSSKDAVGQAASCGLTVTVIATPSPPSPVVSPDCTAITPGAGTLTAGDGAVWALRDDWATIRNSVHAGTGHGSKLEWTAAHTIQTLGTDNAWYLYSGGDAGTWIPTGAGDVCIAVPPPPPPPPPPAPTTCLDSSATNFNGPLPCTYPVPIPTTRTVTVAWNASPSTVTGYQVGYGKVANQYTTIVDAKSVLLFTVAGLDSATTYFFNVRAYDATAQSLWSNEVSTKTP